MPILDTKPAFFLPCSVTASLDVRLPDEIVAIMGRDLKIDYLYKRHCIMVTKREDSAYPGMETECTNGNILRIPDRIEKKLRLTAGETLVCGYELSTDCLIIKRRAETYRKNEQHATGEEKRTADPLKNSRPLQSKRIYAKPDIFVEPALYPYQYQPEGFANYEAPTGKQDDLNAKDALKLRVYVREVLDADGETAILLIWRFGFGIDCNTIRYFSKTYKSVNGVCEAFRFGCKCFLEREAAVSNASLRRVFRAVLADYDVVLLRRRKGISWMSRSAFECDISVYELARCLRQRAFMELENITYSSGRHTVLNDNKIKRLSEYILNLPVEYGGLLLLYYYRRYEASQIEDQMNISYVKGKIEHLRRALSGRLGFAEKLISDGSFRKACAMCANRLRIC